MNTTYQARRTHLVCYRNLGGVTLRLVMEDRTKGVLGSYKYSKGIGRVCGDQNSLIAWDLICIAVQAVTPHLDRFYT
jgi:hypothetical protein